MHICILHSLSMHDQICILHKSMPILYDNIHIQSLNNSRKFHLRQLSTYYLNIHTVGQSYPVQSHILCINRSLYSSQFHYSHYIVQILSNKMATVDTYTALSQQQLEGQYIVNNYWDHQNYKMHIQQPNIQNIRLFHQVYATHSHKCTCYYHITACLSNI